VWVLFRMWGRCSDSASVARIVYASVGLCRCYSGRVGVARTMWALPGAVSVSFGLRRFYSGSVDVTRAAYRCYSDCVSVTWTV